MIRILVTPLILLISNKDIFLLRSLIEADGYSMFILLIIPFVTFIVHNRKFLAIKNSTKDFYGFIISIILFLLGLFFMSTNLLTMLVLVEISRIAVIFIFIRFSKDQDKESSFLFILFTNLSGSMPLILFILISISLQVSIINNFNFYQEFMNNHLIIILYSLIFLRKIPIFLIHFWLTKAHVRAFGAISIILARLLLKFGCVGLLKFYYFFNPLALRWRTFTYFLSLWGMNLIYIIILRFIDIKFVIAASSIVHIAILFPLSIMSRSIGLIARIYIITTHGIVSFILFYIVTLFYETNLNRRKEIRGGRERLKIGVTAIIIFFLLLNLGVPPFTRFLSELYFLIQTLKFRALLTMHLIIVIIFRMILTIYLIIKIIYFKKNFKSNLNNSPRIFLSFSIGGFIIVLINLMVYSNSL